MARHDGQNYVVALLTGYCDPPAGVLVLLLLNSMPKFTKFVGLVPSPILLREKKNKEATKDGKKGGDTHHICVEKHEEKDVNEVNGDINERSKDGVHDGVHSSHKNLSMEPKAMAALESFMKGSSSQNTVLEEFPILSREVLNGGNKSKLAKPPMEASMAAKETFQNMEGTRKSEIKEGTRKADFKATNQFFPSIADYAAKLKDTRTKQGKVDDPLPSRADWADLERDIHSKCGEMNDIAENNLVALNRTTPIHGNMTNSTAANVIPYHTPEPIIIGDIDIHAHTMEVKSNAFLESNRTTLRFIEPELIHGNVFVQPTWDMVQRGKVRWTNTDVGYFLGKKLSFMGVKNYVNSIWKGLVEVKATSNGFYFFKFESDAHLLHVLEGGPWMFMEQPLFMERWKEGMTLEKKPHQEVPIWMKFKHLPTEYWTTEGLSTVASSIGKPLYPDVFTTNMERIDYARVCILVSVTAKFPDHIYIMLPSENGE